MPMEELDSSTRRFTTNDNVFRFTDARHLMDQELKYLVVHIGCGYVVLWDNYFSVIAGFSAGRTRLCCILSFPAGREWFLLVVTMVSAVLSFLLTIGSGYSLIPPTSWCHTLRVEYISAERVNDSCWSLQNGCSAVSMTFLLAEYIHAAGVVYAADTSIHAARKFDTAGWLVSATITWERGSEDFTDILSYLDHSPLRCQCATLQCKLMIFLEGMGLLDPKAEVWKSISSFHCPHALIVIAACHLLLHGNDAANEDNAAADEAAGSAAEAHPKMTPFMEDSRRSHMMGPDYSPTPTPMLAGRARTLPTKQVYQAKLTGLITYRQTELWVTIIPAVPTRGYGGTRRRRRFLLGVKREKASMPDLDNPAESLADDAPRPGNDSKKKASCALFNIYRLRIWLSADCPIISEHAGAKELDETMLRMTKRTAHNGTIIMTAVKAMSKQQLIEEYENICRRLEKNVIRFHPAGSAPPLSGSAAPTSAGGVFGVPDSTVPTIRAKDLLVHTEQVEISPFAMILLIFSSPYLSQLDHITNFDVLFENPHQRGIMSFFLDSDGDSADRGRYISGAGVVVVDKLSDDEIVDPRVKVETIPDSAASPPRSRRKHRGVRSDDSLWDKPVEDFFSSESESDDDMENYIPPLPYGAFQDWEMVICPLSHTGERMIRHSSQSNPHTVGMLLVAGNVFQTVQAALNENPMSGLALLLTRRVWLTIATAMVW
ncbi:hypothetical protein Tco_1107165 [Tanacetum coccineum]